jgi:hypothetical protein
MNHTLKSACACMVFLCMAAMAVPADVLAPGTAQKLTPAQGKNDLGLVFSSGDILLDLESYEGGFGGKIGWGKFCLRSGIDLLINGSSDSFSLNATATGEYHLAPGPISPYIGGYVEAGYMSQAGTTSTIPLSVGAVAGVEVFLLDFLSVFAEYALACDFTFTTDLQASTTAFDYLVDTGMGNNSQLGIIIYLSRIGAK